MSSIGENKCNNGYGSNVNELNIDIINVCVRNIRPKYNNLAEWIGNQEEHVYIGRKGVVFINGVRYPLYDSFWANPYKISEKISREQSIQMYKEYIEKKILDNNLIPKLLELKGKKLGCWCKPECCHGDVLVELVKKYNNTN